jgi:26S proteasome regulatory subunit N5
MSKREKTEFILEQFRLCLLKKDFVKAQIVSKKISSKFFDNSEYNDLKIRYYKLMIQHSMNSNDHLLTCKHYRCLYDTFVIKGDQELWKEVMFFNVDAV